MSKTKSRILGIQENYFSIDDILCGQERVLCKFEVPVMHMGYLDPGAESEHINAGSQLELAFWLAKSLCTRRKHTATIELPKQYREGYREVIRADAAIVDLHKLGPYYYNFGTHLLQFQLAETNDVAKSLLHAFQTRLRRIMDSSQNALDVDSIVLMESLDETERLIFSSGQRGLADFLRWETRQTEKLTTSEMVTNLKKRKRIQMEETA